MDKRELSERFGKRLRELIDRNEGGAAAFVKDTGIDRSALSQFLDPQIVRLPRAEALRNIATARGVSVDWLLDLENAPDGRQQVSTSFEIETASEGEITPLERWRREAAGHKLRYVPSTLPDMLSFDQGMHFDTDQQNARAEAAENVLDGMVLGEMDIEIAMPIQRLLDLRDRCGLWRDQSARASREQLRFMARICQSSYPALRLHLYDERKVFSAPFTVFGKLRVAIYVGEAYLVITGREQINTFVSRFDHLVRCSEITSDKAAGVLSEMADQLRD